MKHSKPIKRSKVTVASVKSLIHSGVTYSSQLAKHLKVSRQYMGRFLRKMVENNEIEIDVLEGNGKVAKYYQIVEKKVTQLKLTEWSSGLHSGLHYFRDGVQISYGIINYDKWFKPDIEWELGKTLMKGITIDDTFIRIANDRTVTFIFPKIYGKDEVEPITKADFKSYEIKTKFLKMYPDFELTPLPTNMILGSLGTTKLSEVLQEYSGIKTDSFVIDGTPNKGSLEMNITDPIRTTENMRDTVDFFATGGIKLILHELHSLNQLMAGFITRNVAIENAILLIAQTLKKLGER